MRRLIGWVLACVLIVGCGSDQTLAPLGRQDVILAFGDSLTQGVGVAPEFSYPSVLEGLSGRKVVNAGISGEVTQQGSQRFKQVLDETKPALVILLEGGNDILRNLSAQETERNLSEMITTAKNENVAVVLVGVPEKKLFSSHAPLYQSLAEKHQVPFEGSIIAELMKDTGMKSDSVHFNQQGYRKLAERLNQFLREEGALAN